MKGYILGLYRDNGNENRIYKSIMVHMWVIGGWRTSCTLYTFLVSWDSLKKGHSVHLNKSWFYSPDVPKQCAGEVGLLCIHMCFMFLGEGLARS